jgi:hypothetical protein
MKILAWYSAIFLTHYLCGIIIMAVKGPGNALLYIPWFPVFYYSWARIAGRGKAKFLKWYSALWVSLQVFLTASAVLLSPPRKDLLFPVITLILAVPVVVYFWILIRKD